MDLIRKIIQNMFSRKQISMITSYKISIVSKYELHKLQMCSKIRSFLLNIYFLISMVYFFAPLVSE